MRRILSLAFAATLAVAGLGITAGSTEAGWHGGHGGHGHYGHHHGHNDFDFNFGFGLGFGGLYPFGGYYPPFYMPYQSYYAPPAYYYGGGGGGSSWCARHYRSYRASDNTYQPYNGPRRVCRG